MITRIHGHGSRLNLAGEIVDRDPDRSWSNEYGIVGRFFGG
jgi:hypothetical protein